MRKFYTAEAVTEGHPDKVCDQIADAILDVCLKNDADSKVACEVLATKGMLLLLLRSILIGKYLVKHKEQER